MKTQITRETKWATISKISIWAARWRMLLHQKSRFVLFMAHNLLVTYNNTYHMVHIVNLRLVVLKFTFLKSHLESDLSEKMKVDGHISYIWFVNRIQIQRTVQIERKSDLALRPSIFCSKDRSKFWLQDRSRRFTFTNDRPFLTRPNIFYFKHQRFGLNWGWSTSERVEEVGMLKG